MQAKKLIEKLIMATEGSNSLSSEVFKFLVQHESAEKLFCWVEDDIYMYPPLTESLDVSSESFVEKQMVLDFSVTNHICKLKIFIGPLKICDVKTAGKDCIPRAICAAGITYLLETNGDGLTP